MHKSIDTKGTAVKRCSGFTAFLFILVLMFSPALSIAAEPVSNANKTVALPSGGTRDVTALQVDLTDPNIRIFSVHAKNAVGATAPLKDIAAQLAGENYEVVCAINGTFFDAYVNGPKRGMGTVIYEGLMIYKLDGTFIGFGANNEVKMDWIHIECIGCVDNIMDRYHSFYIHNWNRVLPPGSSYRETVLTSAFGENTGNTDMNVLVIRGGFIQSISKGNTAIPKDGYVYLYPDSSPYNDGRFQTGKPCSFGTTYYDRGGNAVDWSNIRNITGVGPSLVKKGVKTANAAAEDWTDIKLTTNAGQRSFIGFDQTGKKLIMGTAPNCTISQLGDVAMAYGLQEAMNLDGGASSGLLYRDAYLTAPGRHLSNAIVVVRQKQTGAVSPPSLFPSNAVTATPTASTVLVDGEKVAFDAYNLGGNNYFKLRDLAYVLNGTKRQFEVGWDAGKNAISLTSNRPYTEVGGELAKGSVGSKQATPSNSKIFLNGKQVQLTAYNIDGNNYFNLRDIGQALYFEVGWDNASNTIIIDTILLPRADLAATQSKISFNPKTDVTADGRMKMAKAEEYMMNNLKSLSFYEENDKFYFEGYVAEAPEGFENRFSIYISYYVNMQQGFVFYSSYPYRAQEELPDEGPFREVLKGVTSNDQIDYVEIEMRIEAIDHTSKEYDYLGDWTIDSRFDNHITVGGEPVSSKITKKTNKPYDLSAIFQW